MTDSIAFGSLTNVLDRRCRERPSAHRYVHAVPSEHVALQCEHDQCEHVALDEYPNVPNVRDDDPSDGHNDDGVDSERLHS